MSLFFIFDWIDLFVCLFVIYSGNGSGKGNNNPPALCQWNEVLTHPGLVCCLTQTTSIPVILMIEPDKIRVQEIKTLPAKAKVWCNILWCIRLEDKMHPL